MRDSNFRTPCLAPGATVTATLGGGLGTGACAVFSPSSQSAVVCSVPIPDSAFASTDTAASFTVAVAYGGAVRARSAAVGFTLAAVPAAAPTPSVKGIYAQLPVAPAYPGDEISVPIFVQPGPFVTVGFDVELYYDPTVLTYTSFSAPMFISVLDGIKSVGVATANSPGRSAPASAVAGFFQLGTFVFTVNSALAGNTTVSIQGRATQLVDESIFGYVDKVAAQFSDARGGAWQASGQLQLTVPGVVGAYATLPQPTVVNLAPVTATPTSLPLTVRGVLGTPRTQFTDSALVPTACTSRLPQVMGASLDASGCRVTFGAVATAGSSLAGVQATAAGLEVNAALSVFYPQSVILKSAALTLRTLGCDFETARLMLVADLGGDGLPTLGQADITAAVPLSSSDPSVLSLAAGPIVRGVAPGTARIGTPAGGSRPANVTITVSSAAVAVQDLRVYAFSSTTVSNLGSLSDGGTATAAVSPVLSLRRENATASLAAFALLADGNLVEVSFSRGLTVITNATGARQLHAVLFCTIVCGSTCDAHLPERVMVGCQYSHS